MSAGKYEETNIIRTDYFRNLYALVVILAVLGDFINQCLDNSWVSKGLFLFIFSFHMSFLMILEGVRYRAGEPKWGEVCRDTTYYLCLYVAAKGMISLSQWITGGGFKFSLLSESGAPWVFLAVAMYELLAYGLRRVDKTVVLSAAILLALLCGYNESIGDFLVLSRAVVFFPFFILGWMCDISALDSLLKNEKIKILGCLILLTAFVFCIYFSRNIYFIRPILTGRNSYKILKARSKYGVLLRITAYISGLVLSMSAMAVTPRRRIKLMSGAGQRFVQIYVLYRPVLYLMMGVHVYGLLERRLGWRGGKIAWMLLGVVTVIVLSGSIFERPFSVLQRRVRDCFKVRRADKTGNICEKAKNTIFVIGCKRSYFLWYTILFAVMFVICFRPFYESGKSLIWKNDGLQQHYTALVYIARWIRTIITERKIPMVDFTIGYGADVMTVLSALDDLLSPLNWVAALFNISQIEYVFDFILVFKYYLAGLTFLMYCFYMKRDYFASLIGSLVYAFCGFCLYAGIRHPSFLTPVIYLPLFLISIEELVSGRRKWIFSVSVAIFGIINYFFCYMSIIIGVIYGIARGITMKKTTREFIALLGKAVFWGGLGLGMAMVILLPVAHSFLNSTRSGADVYYANSALLYPKEYYEKLLLDFASPLSGGAGYWVFISVGAPATIAILLFLFTRQKEQKWLKSVFLTLMLILCIPFAGSAMNGFNYVTNRWVWAICFFAVYILVCETDRMLDAPGYLVGSLLAVLGLTFLIYCIFSKKLVTEHIISFAGMLLVTLMIAFFMSHKSQKKIFEMSILAVSLGGIVLSANYKFDTDRQNYVSEFQQAGKALDITMSNAETSVSGIGDKAFYRISNNTLDTAVNHGMVGDFNSVSYYWSVMDDIVYQYLISAEIPGMAQPFRIYGLDQRCALESLASVKYYAMQAGSQEIVPSGYIKAKTTENPYSGKNDIIYLNRNYLPIGYTYQDTVCTQDYETLNPVQKEQLMLQRLVLDDGTSLTETEFLGEQIAYEVTGSKNITWDKEKGTIQISKAKASLEVSYLVPKGDTIYVRLKGFDTNGSANTAATFTAVTNGLTKKFYSRNDQNTWPIDRENYTLNFGVSDGTEQKVTITFPYKASYKLKDIEIYSVPEYRYSEYIERLRKESLENVIVDTNLIQGDITVSSPRYLCFSVPYSKGWKAYVDGEKVETMKANIMYMAIMLEPGYHQVRLEYCTPGLKTGLLISIICLGILILIVGWKRRKI